MLAPHDSTSDVAARNIFLQGRWWSLKMQFRISARKTRFPRLTRLQMTQSSQLLNQPEWCAMFLLKCLMMLDPWKWITHKQKSQPRNDKSSSLMSLWKGVGICKDTLSHTAAIGWPRILLRKARSRRCWSQSQEILQEMQATITRK